MASSSTSTVLEVVNNAMYRRGYRPSTVQKQLNADRYDTAVTSADKYRKHIDPSFVDQDGRNGVHKAVLLALRESPFVDIPTDGVDNSPASVALDQAVRAGCDVNAVDRSGRRPIHYAADSGHVTCIRRLVRYGVDPNALTTPATSTGGVSGGGTGGKAIHGGGLSPLMLAARASRIDAIRVLLKNGAKATLSNDRSETALHFAAASSEYTEECIGALAGQQAGTAGKHLVNVQDSDGSTALMIAARNKSSPAASAAVRLLIQLGADVTYADTQGRTALHWASLSNQPEVVRLLHTARADLDAVDAQGDTAYVSAIKANSPDALQSLIDVGCDSSMIDGLMGTAVALAAVKV